MTLTLHLNALVCGLFLLCSLGLCAARQVLACLRLFVLQSLLLAAAAAIEGVAESSRHLLLVMGITLLFKVILIPWILDRNLHQAVMTRRELTGILRVPTTLLSALLLILLACVISRAIPFVSSDSFAATNLPIGLSSLLLGLLTIAIRGEAVPQLLGILALENGAFLAAIALVPDLPVIVEVGAAFDVLMAAVVLGVLTRRIHEATGTTRVAALSRLREQ